MCGSSLSTLYDNEMSQWDKTYDSIYNVILDARDSEVEPFILLDWLYESWVDGTNGSQMLHAMYGDWKGDFANNKIDYGVNWAWPSAAKDDANHRARDVLDRIAGKLQKQVQPAGLRQLYNSKLPVFSWKAALFQSRTGSWRVLPQPRAGRLYAPIVLGDRTGA